MASLEAYLSEAHFTVHKNNMLLLFKVDSIVTLTDSASASDAQDGLC